MSNRITQKIIVDEGRLQEDILVALYKAGLKLVSDDGKPLTLGYSPILAMAQYLAPRLTKAYPAVAIMTTEHFDDDFKWDNEETPSC